MPTNPRSSRAVITGLVVTAVLTLAGFSAARGLGLIVPGTLPTENNFFLFNLCIMMFIMIGGYVTARLAPHDPKNHALSLGTVLTIIGLAASLTLTFADYGPDWFGWTILLSGLPFAWLGAKLRRD
jgi:hypothetical protein